MQPAAPPQAHSDAPRSSARAWAKVYLLVIASAVVVWGVLYWLTATYNIPVKGS